MTVPDEADQDGLSPRGRLTSRLATVTGIEEVRDLCDRLSPLEAAVAEDRALVRDLTALVDDVERIVLDRVAAALEDSEKGTDD